MKQLIRIAFMVSVVACGSPIPAETVVLYDSQEGTALDQQGWAYVTRPLLVAKAQRSFSEGSTRLDTTPLMSEWAGFLSRVPVGSIRFSHPRMPELDREAGFTLRFQVRVAEERHTSNDRAGFAVVVVSNDLQAVELGFWTDEVWAQSGPNRRNPGEPLFTRTVELTRIDTAEMALYELRVSGDSYSLQSKGRELLGGPLRDYSAHWHPVYSQTNTIFLGDNTSRASAVVEIARVEVATDTAP